LPVQAGGVDGDQSVVESLDVVVDSLARALANACPETWYAQGNQRRHGQLMLARKGIADVRLASEVTELLT